MNQLQKLLRSAAVILLCGAVAAFSSCNPNSRFDGGSGITISAIISEKEKESSLQEVTDVDALLTDIMEAGPQTSSNPGDYIEADREDYDRLLAMDMKALKEMFACFEETKDSSLKGHIMALACQDILGDEAITDENYEPISDGYQWYKAYCSAIGKAQDSLSVKDMKINYPKTVATLPQILAQPELKGKTAVVIGILDKMFDTGSVELQYLPAGFKEGDNVLSFDISYMRARFRHLWSEYRWESSNESDTDFANSMMDTSPAIRLLDSLGRSFILYPERDIVVFASNAGAMFQVTGGEDDSLWKSVRYEFDSLEADVNNVTVETESTDFEEIARLFLQAVGEHQKKLTEGNMAKAADFAIVDLEILLTDESNDAVFCFGATTAGKPEYKEPSIFWYAGNGAEGTGEYEGYIVSYHQYRLEREDNVWRCTDSGTGGIRLYDNE